jgi:hypothetical protein
MTSNKTRTELRKHQRITPARQRPVVVDLNGSNFIDVVVAQDISVGGLRLLIQHRFEGCEIDKIVDLTIKLPRPIARTIKASGKIRHLTGNTFGVSFLDMTRQDQQILESYTALHTGPRSLWDRFTHWFGGPGANSARDE